MDGDALMLLWLSFVGTVFWVANPDALVILYVAGRGRPPLEAALLALCGQAVMLLLLFFLGDRLRARSAWLHRKCESVRLRWGPRLEKSALPVTALSGLVGIPPSVALVVLAAALRLPPRRFLLVFFVCRALWFIGLALVGVRFR